MSDLLRMTGLVSGLDTQSIVQGLVSAASYKTTKLKNNQKKLEWKQEAWKSLNSKLYSFYSGNLSDMKLTSTFQMKKATLADSSIATAKASSNAVHGSQTLAVHQLATSGYLTGGEITKRDGSSASASTTLGELSDAFNGDGEIKINVKKGSGDTDASYGTVTLNKDMTMAEVAKAFGEVGLNANFDSSTGRFFINSKESGEAANFKLEAENGSLGQNALETLNLIGGKNGAHKIEGKDAEIELNGAVFKSKTNTFDINGLTITADKESEKLSDGSYKQTTVTVSTDVDGIYDKIKGYIKEYGELIKEMDKLYNAADASKYNVLSDEEKEALSDEEVEKWEGKIKDSLLRRDDNLNTIINSFKNAMSSTFEIGGKSYSLSSFGVNTLGYFEAADNEKGVYHIDGNADDESTKSKDDVLKKMIGTDPELVGSFFSKLTKGLYDSLSNQMKSVEGTRSFSKLYDDKRLKTEYDNIGKEITAQEKYVSDLEDRYYAQFSKMETALSKLQNSTSSLTGMMGG